MVPNRSIFYHRFQLLFICNERVVSLFCVAILSKPIQYIRKEIKQASDYLDNPINNRPNKI